MPTLRPIAVLLGLSLSATANDAPTTFLKVTAPAKVVAGAVSHESLRHRHTERFVF